MPKGMPKAQQSIWVALAPHATTLGTLTPATARSFGRLCEAMAVADRLLAQIETQGDTVDGDAHPLLSKWIALKVRVEAGEARFLVTANGKPTAAAPAPVVNPLDRFIKRA
jgi:hypothetical protein